MISHSQFIKTYQFRKHEYLHQDQYRRQEQLHHWLWKVSPKRTESTNHKKANIIIVYFNSQYRPSALLQWNGTMGIEKSVPCLPLQSKHSWKRPLQVPFAISFQLLTVFRRCRKNKCITDMDNPSLWSFKCEEYAKRGMVGLKFQYESE